MVVCSHCGTEVHPNKPFWTNDDTWYHFLAGDIPKAYFTCPLRGTNMDIADVIEISVQAMIDISNQLELF